MTSPRLRRLVLVLAVLLLASAAGCVLQLEGPALRPVVSDVVEATLEAPPVPSSRLEGETLAPALLPDGRRLVLVGVPVSAAEGDVVPLHRLVGDSVRHRSPAGVSGDESFSLEPWEPDYLDPASRTGWRAFGWVASASVLAALGLPLLAVSLLVRRSPLRLPVDAASGRAALSAYRDTAPAMRVIGATPFVQLACCGAGALGSILVVPLEAPGPILAMIGLIALSLPSVVLCARYRRRLADWVVRLALPAPALLPVWTLSLPEGRSGWRHAAGELGGRSETFEVLVGDDPEVTVGELVGTVRALEGAAG